MKLKTRDAHYAGVRYAQSLTIPDQGTDKVKRYNSVIFIVVITI